MKKKRNRIIGCALALLFILAGGSLWFKAVAPPGESWIAYQNEELTASIDHQLRDLDIEQTVAAKESLVLEQDIESLQKAVEQGDLSYAELTAICLYRIKTLDQNRHGYNSVMEVAPDAMDQARDRDRRRERSGGKGLFPLFGIPVMLKDNINTAGIPTSAGAVAFAAFLPAEDAELVQRLREQGAVILGKNNLSEFANFVSSVMPGGYSGKKGQTVNPFRPLKLSPSGSSSGSAVAVTANLAPVSVGTETAGSIIGPAAANSVVGFKPTRGTISGEGIFPLIRAVDTPGPIAKTVRDAAAAYGALSGQTIPGEFDPSALKGASVGLVVYDYNDSAVIQKIRAGLIEAGARVSDVSLDQTTVEVQTVIELTFKRDFEEFAGQYRLPVATLDDLIRFNSQDARRRARYGQDCLTAAARVQAPNDTPIENSIKNARNQLDELFYGRDMDAVVFLNTTCSSIVSAAGCPELTIPLGMDKNGVLQGATFAAGYGDDIKLLNLGYSFEQTIRGRVAP